MDEGAKGYLIRVTNDDMAGPGSYAETVSANARDMMAISKVLGVERTFDLNYNNHMMDNIARSELRARFIFLFRLLKADIVVTYDPWGESGENPDHYVTSACVEAAAWMAGGDKDYPEHFAAGVTVLGQGKVLLRAVPAACEPRRGHCSLGRAQDRSEPGEQSTGPGRGERPAFTRTSGCTGPALAAPGSDDASANRNYIREFVLQQDRITGQRHGLTYAERFHYIGPSQNHVEEYIRKNAISR